MDIVGWIFLGLAVIALIVGIIKGFIRTLFGFVAMLGSLVISALLTPSICNIPFVQNLIEDAPLPIGDGIFILRTFIIFCILLLICFVICLAIKGLFKWVFNRVKPLKIIDKILGALLSVAMVWMVFGALYSFAYVGSSFFAGLDESLASAGIQFSISQMTSSILQSFCDSGILNTVYSVFNPIGDLVLSILA